jgi:hypothetical protein
MAKKPQASGRKRRSGSLAPRAAGTARATSTDRLLSDVRSLIEAARQQVAQAVNAGLVTLYWHVGQRIRQEVLREERAAYGEQIVSTLSKQLMTEYGQGFNRSSIFRMIRFAEVFPDKKIVSALRTQLTESRAGSSSHHSRTWVSSRRFI